MDPYCQLPCARFPFFQNYYYNSTRQNTELQWHESQLQQRVNTAGMRHMNNTVAFCCRKDPRRGGGSAVFWDTSHPSSRSGRRLLSGVSVFVNLCRGVFENSSPLSAWAVMSNSLFFSHTLFISVSGCQVNNSSTLFFRFFSLLSNFCVLFSQLLHTKSKDTI